MKLRHSIQQSTIREIFRGCGMQRVKVGVVTDVEGTIDRSRLAVKTEKGELLIPMVSEICRMIDPAAKRIVIEPPPGLLELNERRSLE